MPEMEEKYARLDCIYQAAGAVVGRILIPYIGIVWTHAPMLISEIIMGLINELHQAAGRKIYEDHHM